MKATIDNVNIGDGITMIAKTAKTITVQKDNATLDNWKPEIIPGGFAGHCTNQNSQKYIYTQNKNNRTEILRTGKDGNLHENGNKKATVILGREEFYDYNF